MAVDSNVSISKSVTITNQNLKNKQHNYHINPNAVDKTPQKDTVQLSKPKKEGVSTGTKWGLGVLALAGIGAIAYFATRGKVGTKQAQQLVEHIDFKPAKTIDEARIFAHKTLNVQYLHENKGNLDMLNTVNEWLYREKYVTKNKIPDFVNFVEMNIENPVSMTDKIYYEGKAYNVLGVNVNYIDKFEDLFDTVFKSHGDINLSGLIRKNNKNFYEVVKPEYQCENIDKLVQKLNAYNTNSTYKEKMEIYDGLSEAISYLGNITAGKNIKMANFSANGSFLHEIGHMLHQDAYKFWDEARTEGSKIYQEFQQSNIQNMAGQVSAYAKSDPLEFVAEIYKRLRNGQTFSDDLMALYKKYDGPVLS